MPLRYILLPLLPYLPKHPMRTIDPMNRLATKSKNLQNRPENRRGRSPRNKNTAPAYRRRGFR